MIELPVETEILRACARARVHGSRLPGTLGELLPRANWHHLLWLGHRQGGLAGLSESASGPEFARHCPAEFMTQLAEVRASQHLLALARAREVCRLADLFERHSIRALALDRSLSAHASGLADYPSQAGASLHYLVPATELERAASVVADSGHPLTADPEKLLHRGISPVRLNRGLGQHRAVERLWKETESLDLGGRRHRVPSARHWLCERAARHDLGEISLNAATEIVLLCARISPEQWTEVWSEAAVFSVQEQLRHLIATGHAGLGLPFAPALPPAPAATTLKSGRAASIAHPGITVPYLPTPPRVVERMLALAGTRPDDCVCDLGCGDGRIVLTAAEKFGARGFGLDCDPQRIIEASALAQTRQLSGKVAFAAGDLFAADLSLATVVTCYLLPQFQPPLLEKLRREARPGTRIVSHDYTFPDWPPEKTEVIRTGPLRISHIYLWRLP